MHFSTVFLATVVSFAGSSYAWAQDADGNWVANNIMYIWEGMSTHEACTDKDSDWGLNVRESGPCTYWIDGNGNQFHGTCVWVPGLIKCT
ncbi:hypothetical protein CJF32_00005134 [Rutstroemia sp. NJR-2017a WRK4]|nr:hypothetical protein CJF32_00005134 [Rutstroemia sp. NJR-2017a WRK4]